MADNPDSNLADVLAQVRACTLCQHDLPYPPRPVIRAKPSAKLLVIGQAPGLKVHNSGVPWDDPSGDRLRQWMNIDKAQFYNEEDIAIMPMGFCYPGKGPSGDLPPRKECAASWHQPVLNLLPNIRLTLLVGQYAQKYYLQDQFTNLTKTVLHWRNYLPDQFVLPHPSPRNQIWLKKNPWFNLDVVPDLQRSVHRLLFDGQSQN